MVAWSTMVWELAVGDTVVLTFIWPHVGTMAELATMFEEWRLRWILEPDQRVKDANW